MNPILQNINNIIFDLGEVIVHTDARKTVDAFDRLANGSTEKYYSYQDQIALFDDMDTGRVDPAGFRDELRALLSRDFSDEQIDNAWNAMLEEVPKDKLDVLSELKGKYRTFVLSNTNQIHVDWIGRFMEKHYDMPGLEPYFEKVYYSHVIGYRKPEPEAYLRILRENRLEPSETLFIDDKAENIEAAQQLGMKGFLMEERGEFFDLFAR